MFRFGGVGKPSDLCMPSQRRKGNDTMVQRAAATQQDASAACIAI